jgi:NAD-dependent dihydropyrimidine dehydrogenase PreA subunit
MKSAIGLKFAALILAVVLLSFLAAGLWQGKPEKKETGVPLVFRDGMTIAEFGIQNGLPSEVLKKAFLLQNKEDLQKTLESLNIPRNELSEMVVKARALEAEYESKNWVKIPLKFGLWFLFLGGVFFLMRRRKITPRLRRRLYLSAALLFGVILGSDPGPMGTIKDAIVLFGAKGVIFPPRMIALTVFLLLVFLANKFICAWGCQAGTLQDLIFRLNRNQRDTGSTLKQYRPPFLWTNAVRIAFFLLFTLAAFAWATDLIEPIDPFKIYKPTAIGIGGGIFLGLILIAALFVYRPWCQLFCPFGLIGWLIEKISLFRIAVNHQTCIGCRSCEKACPSTVMGAILKRDRVIPDCFACGTCIEVCPTESIRLAVGKRGRPPEGRFLAGTPDQQRGRHARP